jgi:hypothetical protein
VILARFVVIYYRKITRAASGEQQRWHGHEEDGSG